jgi:hypothetical protein
MDGVEHFEFHCHRVRYSLHRSEESENSRGLGKARGSSRKVRKREKR